MLSDGTNTYLYGLDRLASLDPAAARTWALHDALGSVRAMLDTAGSRQTTTSYDTWGTPLAGTTPNPFGFTGERHSEGLVYLRARWYDATSGTFRGYHWRNRALCHALRSPVAPVAVWFGRRDTQGRSHHPSIPTRGSPAVSLSGYFRQRRVAPPVRKNDLLDSEGVRQGLDKNGRMSLPGKAQYPPHFFRHLRNSIPLFPTISRICLPGETCIEQPMTSDQARGQTTSDRQRRTWTNDERPTTNNHNQQPATSNDGQGQTI